jgi:transposase
MPIINRLLERMRLGELLGKHLPKEDRRTKIDTPRVVLLLLKNLLISREPVYGVAEWASHFGPDLFDLWSEDIEHLNDDRVGRCLDRVAAALDTNLIMEVVAQVVAEFDLSLDELHNDSTTVTFHGDHAAAQAEQTRGGQTLPAITWGHNKDHRPDLKQLLYILTVSEDGGVPVYFQAASGNVADDQTHQTTWKLMAQLVQRPDFVYVADCKLATTDNMNEIARLGGRFITVLPATRKENTEFRTRLRQRPDTVCWVDAYPTCQHDGSSGDLFRVCQDEQVSKEGYRLLWFHSRRKAHTDASARAGRLQRALQELEKLRDRLRGPRTRFRQRQKVAQAAQEILDNRGVGDFLRFEISEIQQEHFHQTHPGRPTKNTKYKRTVELRFELRWKVDLAAMDAALAGDGVFPLISNLKDWSAAEILQAYKRQPIIEKRFFQLKTDFQVAPVYLKSVSRIVGLLAVYFFALMVQALLERELRRAMKSTNTTSIPLYPEGRPCRRPTTRQLIDVFEPIMRHTIHHFESDEFEMFGTELSPIHDTILKLLGISITSYTG